MSRTDFVIVGIIFLAMFTIFKVENEKNNPECKNKMKIGKSIERPLIFKAYE